MTAHRLPVLLAALWWGGISGLSFVAVPVLFSSLGNPALAGPVAARLFSVQCWAGMLLGLSLVLLLRRQRQALEANVSQRSPEALREQLLTSGLVVLATALAMLQEFGVAQKIVSARATGGNLRLWHTLGSVMVLGQWLGAGAVLWRLCRPSVRP